ncbi:MAG: DUF1801 domain-containing protein [Cohaesibacter sp.]|nr:DUF1801 domain-containing protein [Cohaesibacter sp.]
MTEQNAAEHKIAHSLNSPFTDPDIRKAFETFDKEACDALLFIRTLIYGLAEKDQHIGHIIESLKWGQPSYDTSPKTGTPIRLGILKGKRIVQKPHVALFTHCQSSVMTQARLHYEDTLTFDGNRALLLPLSEPLPEAPLTHIIRVALRYRLDQ